MSDIVINERDNVGITLAGKDSIPKGHKFALKDIKKNEYIYKYGEIIGRAKEDIKKGGWVHTHNVSSHLDEEIAEYKYEYNASTYETKYRTFKGFKRKIGRAGIRNEIYIIPTVGCVNGVCERLEKLSRKYIKGSIDGIYALTHQFGCSQLGVDNENIRKLLVSTAKNPNASYVLFIGLGCENNQLLKIKEDLKDHDNMVFFNAQDVEDELSYGLEIIKDFIDKASVLEREDVDFKELCIGLKCGGSDGFSGLTANPLVGKISDRIISYGGSAVLTEVPEMFGAERILMDKCETEEVFESYKKMIVDFKKSYTDLGYPVYENPSPGNKEGGITTLEEKSLGCIKKAGSSKIVDCLEYGDMIRKNGLNVLNAPGNDLIAATALAASGCQMVLFTTGRGTPFSTFVPTMKISSNESLSEKKNNWIDYSAYSMNEDGLFDLIEKTINGKYEVKSEDIREIAFYKTGVTL